ncbi:MAG: hypothetical protein D8M28_09590 [Proteobacteria bacterium]|nr:hypothetical protein [Pseudomonadota bacterium]
MQDNISGHGRVTEGKWCKNMSQSKIYFLLPGAVVFSLCLMVALPRAHAQKQALSKSLIECSIVFELNRMMAIQKRRPADDLEKYDAAIDGFKNAARDYAEKEKQPQGVDNYINDTYASMMPKWQSKFNAITNPKSVPDVVAETKDLMDWISYCAAFGKKLGILPVK